MAYLLFSNHFITNFPHNVPEKNFENRSIFREDTVRTKICGLLFFGPPGSQIISFVKSSQVQVLSIVNVNNVGRCVWKEVLLINFRYLLFAATVWSNIATQYE